MLGLAPQEAGSDSLSLGLHQLKFVLHCVCLGSQRTNAGLRLQAVRVLTGVARGRPAQNTQVCLTRVHACHNKQLQTVQRLIQAAT